MIELLSTCLHDLTALGPGGLAALCGALFLAGLGGGFTHCALMCAPFVLAQVGAGADRHAGGGRLRRLSGAALLPYHAGRLLGYAGLGAAFGAAGGLLNAASGWRGWLALPLFAAALLCLAFAMGRAWSPPIGTAWLGRRLAWLLEGAGPWRGLLLGIALSGLPCGLLYGALAGAAASGSALAGALAMAAFVLGTVPALVGVGLSGRLMLRRAGPWLRPASALLLAANAVLLAAMAVRQLV